MKIFVAIILIAVLAAIGVQIFFIVKERNNLRADLGDSNSRLQALLKENADLQSDIEYFSHPENLEKELKSKFNYKKPDEKMIIVVP
jgi:cell division protein FtsL